MASFRDQRGHMAQPMPLPDADRTVTDQGGPAVKRPRRGNIPYEFPSIDETDERAWDELVEASEDGWVFSLATWQRLILAVEDWQLEEHSFAVRRGDELLAVMPLQLDRRSMTLASSGFGLSGPVLSSRLGDKQRMKVLRAIFARSDDIARRHEASALLVGRYAVTRSALANRRGVNPFLDFGFTDISSHTRVIDLSIDEAALWSGLSQSARQTIQAARDTGCQVNVGDWSSMLEDYYRIHSETYRRTGVTPHPRAYFEGIAGATGQSGHSVLLVARSSGGEPIAFHNDARLADGCLYHTGCSTESALEIGANYLLFWESMLQAKNAGCLWYESGEVFPGVSTGKQHGLSIFKSKFGGEIHRSFRAILHVSPGAGRTMRAAALEDESTTNRRRALRAWLDSSRLLLKELLGPRTTAALAPTVRAFRNMVTRLSRF